ncbi:alpha-glucuronidase family glycosyl hydrolase [Ruminiclostridium cellobioparum]|uniref:Xylan alpha-1,2-glucuronidase n=1 Tax=Ruminiclostridium cellobioparum subsp. termitidis CT1112 TaxID=1195236 RepID=S0FWP5_RUMCE|nr:alpha-glucuronidase family glycosyl hydrolase [Ruminiclostridium cellobioparum]EMS73594.1 Alpha-glucuronidase [Ruminiclostridium cellobioparum subsp. termitidis CT1112]
MSNFVVAGNPKSTSMYKCWLKYYKLENKKLSGEYKNLLKSIVIKENTAITQSAVNELKRGLAGILGIRPEISEEPAKPAFLMLGTLSGNKSIAGLLGREKQNLGEEGFIIKLLTENEQKQLLVAGKTDRGLLYGVFSLLRLIQTGTGLDGLPRIENPVNQLRMVNHWDNMDRSIERGYAGKSIFYKNNKITGNLARISDYARMLASVGINAIAINNVNVHKFETLLITDRYIKDAAKLNEIFRSYGIKLFLSINFASPLSTGELFTADPLDKEVRKWWKNRAEFIYAYMPDFGGFLVKADSEGRPGPFTYGRTHADGANMLAEALKPHGGLVIWRCFVYNCLQDWRDRTIDRAKAAYDHFMPLDGAFAENVLLQIKNGPMDFQVREPVSPLIGGLEKTNQVLELQTTQEYTGQQKHLCYLVPMWKEVLDFDTCAKGRGTSVKKIISREVFKNKYGGFATVTNIGDDTNWTGHQMAQANTFGYARLAWDPELTSEEIAESWIRLTYSNDRILVDTIKDMLLGSWRTYENYTSPLGIGWMVNPNHHYGPNVDGYEYDKWGTYHRADHKGIGVDRNVRNGTGYAGQYHKEVARLYENVETCPEELLLFFHYIPYDYRLKSGETLIQYIYNTHFEGVEQAEELKRKWESLKDKVEEDVFGHVMERLEGQITHSKEWRDIINTYFFRKTGIPDELGRKIY